MSISFCRETTQHATLTAENNCPLLQSPNLRVKTRKDLLRESFLLEKRSDLLRKGNMLGEAVSGDFSVSPSGLQPEVERPVCRTLERDRSPRHNACFR